MSYINVILRDDTPHRGLSGNSRILSQIYICALLGHGDMVDL